MTFAQDRKASARTVVRFAGRASNTNSLQSLKQLVGITLILSLRLTDCNLTQPLKAAPPIDVMVSGMVTFVSDFIPPTKVVPLSQSFALESRFPSNVAWETSRTSSWGRFSRRPLKSVALRVATPSPMMVSSVMSERAEMVSSASMAAFSSARRPPAVVWVMVRGAAWRLRIETTKAATNDNRFISVLILRWKDVGMGQTWPRIGL